MYETVVSFNRLTGQTMAGSVATPYIAPLYVTPAQQASASAGAVPDLAISIDQLRAEFQAGMISLATFSAETAAVLRRWNLNGMPPTTTV